MKAAREVRTRRELSSDVFPPLPLWGRPEEELFLDADGALGNLLWQRLRDVRLWARAAPAARKRLFHKLEGEACATEEAAISRAPEITEELKQLGVLVRYPQLVAPRGVAGVCLAISEWADHQHMLETALHFAEAAATADPTYPMAAAIAGSFCTRAVVMDRAATWFHRSIKLSLRQKDWEWYTRAHIRLGILYFQLGDHRQARKMYLQGARNGAWAGYREFAGQGWHGMVTVEGEAGSYKNGQKYALLALDLYPISYYGVPHLAHDYAFLLIRQGWYSAARPILNSVLEALPPDDRARIIVLGTVARVSAGLRDWATFERVSGEILLRAEISKEGAATAFVHLAEGALLLQEYDEAERLAAQGLAIAIQRREADSVRMAYATLDRIMLRAKPEPDCTPPANIGVAATVERFLQRMTTARAPVEQTEAPAPVPANLTALTALAK